MSFSWTVTPNKTGILFSSHRPRGYWIHQKERVESADLLDDPKDGNWGERLLSVTGVLGVLDKPALTWWSMEIGVAGVLELIERKELEVNPHVKILDDAIATDDSLLTDVKRISKLLTKNKLTCNHVRDRAGDRGLNAHAAFETWAETGILPDAAGFPEDQRPFVEGMLKFFAESKLENVSTEVMVASRAHQYGGRYDLRCKLTNERYGMVSVPSVLDLKTSKRVYVGHFLQMEAYEGAGVECGWKPSEQRVVVHCVDGDYRLVRSADVSKDGAPCSFEDFLAVLRVKRIVDRLGGL